MEYNTIVEEYLNKLKILINSHNESMAKAKIEDEEVKKTLPPLQKITFKGKVSELSTKFRRDKITLAENYLTHGFKQMSDVKLNERQQTFVDGLILGQVKKQIAGNYGPALGTKECQKGYNGIKEKLKVLLCFTKTVSEQTDVLVSVKQTAYSNLKEASVISIIEILNKESSKNKAFSQSLSHARAVSNQLCNSVLDRGIRMANYNVLSNEGENIPA